MIASVFAASTAGAQAPAFGRVRGTIFDSLQTRRPLEGATVFISGTNGIAVTDERGHFEFDGVPFGKRALTFSTPALDSLGLFTMGRDITVQAGTTAEVSLSTPSFATVWRTLCQNASVARSDSGIMYGSIANAANEQRLQGARVTFSWWDINKQQQQVVVDRPVLSVRSDSVGNYYACGLPLDINLAIDVSADTMSSGPASAMLEAARLTRRDFLVSSEMYVPDSTRRAQGSALVADGLGIRRRGTATLRGTVRDAKGAVVPIALITLPSADTSVRTSEDGTFAVTGLPGGTQPVRVRKLGNGPLLTTVDLKPGRETEVSWQLPPANVLAAVNVRANRPTNRLLADYDQRRRSGFGYYVGERELATKPDIVSAFQGLPALRVVRRGGLATISIERGASICSPDFYLDGKPSGIDEITFFKPEDLYGVEVYSKTGTVPPQYQTMNACGAVLVWTRAIR